MFTIWRTKGTDGAVRIRNQDTGYCARPWIRSQFTSVCERGVMQVQFYCKRHDIRAPTSGTCKHYSVMRCASTRLVNPVDLGIMTRINLNDRAIEMFTELNDAIFVGCDFAWSAKGRWRRRDREKQDILARIYRLFSAYVHVMRYIMCLDK